VRVDRWEFSLGRTRCLPRSPAALEAGAPSPAGWQARQAEGHDGEI